MFHLKKIVIIGLLATSNTNWCAAKRNLPPMMIGPSQGYNLNVMPDQEKQFYIVKKVLDLLLKKPQQARTNPQSNEPKSKL